MGAAAADEHGFVTHRYVRVGAAVHHQLVHGHDADVAVGDEAVLIGGGPPAMTAEDWADLLGTISYEILTGLGPRTPRQYVTGR